MRQSKALTKAERAARYGGTARSKTLLARLERLAKEYREAKNALDVARQIYAAARAEFVGVRALAPDVLTGDEWFHWTMRHPELEYLGVDIGRAILQVLRSHAYNKFCDAIYQKKPKPEGDALSLTLTEITEQLDYWGFEFQSGTPKREVHAALLHLKGVRKLDGRFEIEDMDEVYRVAREDESRRERVR